MLSITDYFSTLSVILGLVSLTLVSLGALTHVIFKNDSRGTQIGLRVMFLFIAAVLGIFTLSIARSEAKVKANERALAALRAQIPIDQFLAEPAGLDSSILGQIPTIRGKLLTINVEAKAIDQAILALPENLQPHTADEIGTVAWLQWDEKITGFRRKGAHVSEIKDVTCVITLIDRKTWKAVGQQKVFDGRDVIAFLKSLPQATE